MLKVKVYCGDYPGNSNPLEQMTADHYEISPMRNAVPIILFIMFGSALPLKTAEAAGVNFVVLKTDPQILHRHLEDLLAVD
jgi:hypothetical protein